MLRVRFFQDTVLINSSEFIRKDKEKDLEYDVALTVFKEQKGDILNPYYHEDLFSNIELYEKDWIRFVEETKYAL